MGICVSAKPEHRLDVGPREPDATKVIVGTRVRPEKSRQRNFQAFGRSGDGQLEVVNPRSVVQFPQYESNVTSNQIAGVGESVLDDLRVARA